MRRVLVLTFAVCSLAVLAACPESGGPLRVDSVEPAQGTSNGGEEVAVMGHGFVPGKTQAAVFFGRKKVENVIIASATKIKVITPNGEKGPIDVKVEFDNGESYKIPNGFRYVEPAAQDNARKAFFTGNKKPGAIEIEKKP